MKKLSILPAILAAFALSSCSSYSLVNSETYNDANLADYHTFRIVTPADGDLPPGMQMVTYYNIAAAIREQMMMRGYTESPTSPLLVNIGLTVHKEIATAPVMPNPTPAPLPPPPVPRPQPGPSPEVSQDVPYLNPGVGPVIQPQRPQRPQRPAGPVGPTYNGMYPYFMYPRYNYWPSTAGGEVITGIYREGVLTMDMVNIDSKVPLFSASVATILDNGDSQFRELKGIAEAVQTLFKKFPVPIEPRFLKRTE